VSIDSIELWHRRARPEPTKENFAVQLGCHFEEIDEMLDVLKFEGGYTNLRYELKLLASRLKTGEEVVTITNRKELLDSLADQVVTAVGTGHCAGMRTAEGIAEVNRSNWSKFDENGNPIFNDDGKIMKGPNYKAPNLEGLY
jgi:hypothetical protein